jgi:hypothetical protein
LADLQLFWPCFIRLTLRDRDRERGFSVSQGTLDCETQSKPQQEAVMLSRKKRAIRFVFKCRWENDTTSNVLERNVDSLRRTTTVQNWEGK